MKKLLFFSIIALSCRNQDIIKDNSVDSVIIKADEAMATSDSLHKATDSITTKVIDEATKNFENLQKEIEKVKTTKKIEKQKIIYRVDTIYIEKKKNFWGKTKTNVKITSDSTIDNISDSTINE